MCLIINIRKDAGEIRNKYKFVECKFDVPPYPQGIH